MPEYRKKSTSQLISELSDLAYESGTGECLRKSWQEIDRREEDGLIIIRWQTPAGVYDEFVDRDTRITKRLTLLEK